MLLNTLGGMNYFLNMSKCLIIQGHLEYLTELQDCYGRDAILSTWANETKLSNYTHDIRSNLPKFSGYCNYNLQFKSVYEGCLKAKALGHTQVLKVRSDILLPEYKILLNKLDLSKLNFFSYHTWDGGYYSDYLIGGPTEEMLYLFEDHESDRGSISPEKLLMGKVKYKPNYILKTLIEYSLLCYSLKWKKDLTQYCKLDELFTYD